MIHLSECPTHGVTTLEGEYPLVNWPQCARCEKLLTACATHGLPLVHLTDIGWVCPECRPDIVTPRRLAEERESFVADIINRG